MRKEFHICTNLESRKKYYKINVLPLGQQLFRQEQT